MSDDYHYELLKKKCECLNSTTEFCECSTVVSCDCCYTCRGMGQVTKVYPDPHRGHQMKSTVTCPTCEGKKICP